MKKFDDWRIVWKLRFRVVLRYFKKGIKLSQDEIGEYLKMTKNPKR